MRIYTRTGDDGTTSLFGGQRLSKDDLRIEENMATMPGESGTGITIMRPEDYEIPDEDGRVTASEPDPIDVLKEEL